MMTLQSLAYQWWSLSTVTAADCWKDHNLYSVSVFAGDLFRFGLPLIGESSIQVTNGSEGRRRHAMYSRCFTSTAIRRYYDVYNKVTLSFIISLQLITSSSSFFTMFFCIIAMEVSIETCCGWCPAILCVRHQLWFCSVKHRYLTITYSFVTKWVYYKTL